MARRGRPRSFDRDEALSAAVDLFWDRGYEGASLSDLQEAMGGISPPSFYAAFGSKEAAFREAVARYRETIGSAMHRALETGATARASIAGMLARAADAYTDPSHPKGCLIVLGAHGCSDASLPAQDHLREMRQATARAIAARLARGVAEGDVRADADVASLAAFYTAVLHSLSLQARDGASRETLGAIIDLAMRILAEESE